MSNDARGSRSMFHTLLKIADSTLMKGATQQLQNSAEERIPKQHTISSTEIYFDAAKAGNLAIIVDCIAHGIDKDEKDGCGRTALHCASWNGHLEVLKYLIETCKVDAEAKTYVGSTALHCASSNGHLEVVKYLIERCQVDKEAKDDDKWTALHYASRNGQLEIVQYLIETGHVDTEAKTKGGLNALHHASRYSFLDIIKYLVETCNVDKEAKDNDGWTALHRASSNGHLEVVTFLIETCKVDKEAKTNFGSTALHRASSNGHLEVVTFLIETCNVDKEAKDNDGSTALHCASSKGHLEVVKYLIKTCQVDKEAKVDDGATALHYASFNGHLEVVQYLIETCQVDKEAKDNDGWTALHYASSNDDLEVVQYLIQDCGANIFVRNNEGQAPYDLALKRGAVTVASFLERRLNMTGSDQSVFWDIVTEEIEASTLYQPANAVMDPACLPIVSSKEVPKIDEFTDNFTIDSLPWYAIVVGAREMKIAGLKESRTYRNIRKRSKFTPLEILYFKLLETFQQPNYTNTYQSIPTREDQLLFVTAERKHGHAGECLEDEYSFRPIPREERDSLVAADIKSNGGRRHLSTVEKREHLGITIQLKRQALDTMLPKWPYYREIVASTLAVIESVFHGAMDDEEIAKHQAQIKDTWERYFPTSKTKRKSLKADHGNEVNKGSSNHGNDLHDNKSKKLKPAKDTP